MKRCARCQMNVPTKNGYCKRCNALRMQASRKTTAPSTEDEKKVRRALSSTFGFLEENVGATVTIAGITLTSHEDGTFSFDTTTADVQKLVQNKVL